MISGSSITYVIFGHFHSFYSGRGIFLKRKVLFTISSHSTKKWSTCSCSDAFPIFKTFIKSYNKLGWIKKIYFQVSYCKNWIDIFPSSNYESQTWIKSWLICNTLTALIYFLQGNLVVLLLLFLFWPVTFYRSKKNRKKSLDWWCMAKNVWNVLSFALFLSLVLMGDSLYLWCFLERLVLDIPGIISKNK